MRLAQVSTEQYLGATGRLLWGVRVHGVRAGDAGGSVERYKSSQGAGSGQGAPTGVRAGVGEESRRTTWNGGGGGGNDWVRAWVRVGESPKGSGPEEKEEGKLQCTYCLCPASIRSPQAPEKVSYARSDKVKLIGPPIPYPQERDFMERWEKFLPSQPTTGSSIPPLSLPSSLLAWGLGPLA